VYVIGVEGTLKVFQQRDADRCERLERSATAAGARTGLVHARVGSPVCGRASSWIALDSGFGLRSHRRQIRKLGGRNANAVCEYRHGEGERKVYDYRQKPGARTLAQFNSFVSPCMRTARKSSFARKKNERRNNAEIRFLPVWQDGCNCGVCSRVGSPSSSAGLYFRKPVMLFTRAHTKWLGGLRKTSRRRRLPRTSAWRVLQPSI
jgi:hypothetical protein